jgi:hypothetical protein
VFTARSSLHFPPPESTGHSGEESISMKKLLQCDGLRDNRKDILDWFFDGATGCIKLPAGLLTNKKE